MKNIAEFLNESTKHGSDIISILNGISFNFVPRKIDYSYEGRTSTAKEIEAEIILKLKERFTNADIYSSVDYAKIIDKTVWSSKYDMENGDIMIISNGETFYIDVKAASKPVASDRTYKNNNLGPIGANSIMNFANKENHIYLLLNCDGTTKYIISGQKLYKEFMKDPVLYASSTRDGKNINLNAKVISWGNVNADTSIVCAQDFIPTKWIYNHINKIIK